MMSSSCFNLTKVVQLAWHAGVDAPWGRDTCASWWLPALPVSCIWKCSFHVLCAPAPLISLLPPPSAAFFLWTSLPACPSSEKLLYPVWQLRSLSPPQVCVNSREKACVRMSLASLSVCLHEFRCSRGVHIPWNWSCRLFWVTSYRW